MARLVWAARKDRISQIITHYIRGEEKTISACTSTLEVDELQQHSSSTALSSTPISQEIWGIYHDHIYKYSITESVFPAHWWYLCPLIIDHQLVANKSFEVNINLLSSNSNIVVIYVETWLWQSLFTTATIICRFWIKLCSDRAACLQMYVKYLSSKLTDIFDHLHSYCRHVLAI